MEMEKASLSPRGAAEEQKEEVIEVAEMDQKQKGLVVFLVPKLVLFRREGNILEVKLLVYS